MRTYMSGADYMHSDELKKFRDMILPILEEGINEAGSMSSFIAAGTSHATHGVNNIPFFIFYSIMYNEKTIHTI